MALRKIYETCFLNTSSDTDWTMGPPIGYSSENLAAYSLFAFYNQTSAVPPRSGDWPLVNANDYFTGYTDHIVARVWASDTHKYVNIYATMSPSAAYALHLPAGRYRLTFELGQITPTMCYGWGVARISVTPDGAAEGPWHLLAAGTNDTVEICPAIIVDSLTEFLLFPFVIGMEATGIVTLPTEKAIVPGCPYQYTAGGEHQFRFFHIEKLESWL